MHVYELRPRKDKRGVDLISDALTFGRCGTMARMRSATQSDRRSFAARSQDALIRICDEASNVIETYDHTGDFREP